jgi:uncharacterized lipoprotein YajG
MKTIIPLLAMMFLAGCGNKSTEPSSSTDSTPVVPPVSLNFTNSSPTNEMVHRNPAVEMTNAPVITNDMGTNIPAATNQ